MESKIMQVFYGNDCLPYKDSQRTVHYPIVGNSFAGSNKTRQINFYVDQIGGTSEVTWVIVSKLPNGKIGYEILDSVSIDDELDENYLVFNLSAYYTQVKGDLFLALRGYEGEVEFVEGQDGVYQISGDPLIEVTGAIKLAINYAPIIPTGTQVLPTDIDLIISALNNAILKNNGILVVSNRPSDLSSYGNGQMFYVRNTGELLRNVSGTLTSVLLNDYILINENTSITSMLLSLGGTPRLANVQLSVSGGTPKLYKVFTSMSGLNTYVSIFDEETKTFKYLTLTPSNPNDYTKTVYSILNDTTTPSLKLIGVDENGDCEVNGNILLQDGDYIGVSGFGEITFSNGGITLTSTAGLELAINSDGSLTYDGDVIPGIVKSGNNYTIYLGGVPITCNPTNETVHIGDQGYDLDLWNGKAFVDQQPLATEDYVDTKVASLGTVLNYKGSKSVSQLNDLTGQKAGDVYNVTTNGTLNAGSVVVVAGDNVVWNGSAWDKLAGTIDLSDYATKTYVDNAILTEDGNVKTFIDNNTFLKYSSVSNSITLSELNEIIGSEPALVQIGANWYICRVVSAGGTAYSFEIEQISNGYRWVSSYASGSIVLSDLLSNLSSYFKTFTVASDNETISGTWSFTNVTITGNISDGTNSVAVSNIAKKSDFVTLTQDEYDALTPDANVFYFIEEE